MEENCLSLLKNMYEKLIANIITPNGEYWNISSQDQEQDKDAYAHYLYATLYWKFADSIKVVD